MRLVKILLITVSMLSCVQVSSAYNKEVEVWLGRLDSSLAHRSDYEKDYVRHVKGLKILMAQSASLEAQYDICRQIYLAYQSYQADSALAYAKREMDLANRMNSESRITLSKLDIAYAYFFIGKFLDAYNYLNGLSGNNLPKDIKMEFYKATYKLWSEFCGVSSEETQKLFRYKRDRTLDSLMALTPREKGEWWKLYGDKACNGDSKYGQALKFYLKATLDTTLDKHTLARVYYNISCCYSNMGENEKSLIAVIRSSIYDNESCTNEIMALYTAAMWIKGYDSKRANHYINEAISIMLAYNGKYRFMNTGGLMSQIYQERINVIESSKELLGLAVILALALIAGIYVALFVIKRKNTRLKGVSLQLEEKVRLLDKANAKLDESNNIKDSYLGQTFYDNVEFIDKLQHIFNKIGRLLVVKKYNDIADIVSSKELDKERDGMYSNFDKTFLTLFPNFITNYNALFEEKDRKPLDKDSPLTNEMRIFALIRLGVKENERIAHFLGYSVNTINTYKTRVKNKSIVPNDEFEERIMEIKG